MYFFSNLENFIIFLKLIILFSYQEEPEQQNYAGVPSLVDTICATRVFCSALLLPTIATFIGRLFYESVPSKVQRTLLVSIATIITKHRTRLINNEKKKKKTGDFFLVLLLDPCTRSL